MQGASSHVIHEITLQLENFLMRQIILYTILGVLLLMIIGGWQIFTDKREGELLLQKYVDINDLPANYRELVVKAATTMPEIPRNSKFEFVGAPDEIPSESGGKNPLPKSMEDTRNARWLGKFKITKADGVERSFLYVIKNGRVSKITPLASD